MNVREFDYWKCHTALTEIAAGECNFTENCPHCEAADVLAMVRQPVALPAGFTEGLGGPRVIGHRTMEFGCT